MVRIKNCNLTTLRKIIKKSKVYCFGCGRQADSFFRKYELYHMEREIEGFIDNAPEKAGTHVLINGIQLPVFSFQQFLHRYNKNTVVLTTSMYWQKMIEQMDEAPELEGLECYIDYFVDNTYELCEFSVPKMGGRKIPKTIHYCWFGGNPIPKQFLNYMESWRKYCPDYEIMEWNEENYDIGKSVFMRQAYEQKKWAFVSDYARLDIIHEYGGIYLDTDVELLKNLDELLNDDMYCGFEQNNYINFGLGFGAVKGHRILKELLKVYDSMRFIQSDGSLNQTACAVYQLEALIRNGMKMENTYQRLKDVTVYPSECFAPIGLMGDGNYITEHTYSIHHYSSTWWDEKAAKEIKALKKNLNLYKSRIC